MDHKKTAASILEKIGGAENVAHLEHCSTRLRFTLVDDKTADVEALKKIDGVMGVVLSAQYQVIIGNEVVEVFKEVRKLGDFNNAGNGGQKENKGKQKLGVTIMDFIISVFQPLVPAMAGSGILKSLLLVLFMFGVMDSTGTTYQVLAYIADGVLYFLPMMIAVSVATKLGTNKMVALGAVGILLLPNMSALITAEGGAKLFGITIKSITYNNQIFQALLCVLFLALMEKAFTKISPKPIRIFFVPMMSLIVTVPVTLLFLGPLGYNVGTYFTSAVVAMYNQFGWIALAILAMCLPFLISVGMHKAFIPYVVTQVGNVGFDILYLPASLAHNIAESGACFGAAIRTKDEKVRATAFSAGISALFGITEPALYGLTITNKRVLSSVIAGSGIGGAFIGIAAVKGFAVVGPGLASMSMFVDPSNGNNIVFAAVGFAVSFLVAFVAAIFLNKNETVDAPQVEEVDVDYKTIVSPLKGQVIPLEEVKDEVFRTGILGEGIAVIPEVGEVYAPVCGVVETIFHTKHAMTLRGDNGAEILIHVGINTVELEGKHYDPQVNEGERVVAGQLLMKFDLDAIQEAGYDITTPVILANGADLRKEYLNKIMYREVHQLSHYNR